MNDKFLTTRQAAAMLGVGTTSIKRWADYGLLRCAKTPGGHRRFYRSAIAAMLGNPDIANDTSSQRVADWVELLTERDDLGEVRDRLERDLERSGSYFNLATAIGDVLAEIGRRGASGELSIIKEHLASERLRRALANLAANILVPANADHALLLAADGDDHTLGLSLVEVCLRAAGWQCHWGGRHTPFADVEGFVASRRIRMLAISASSASRDRAALAAQARRFASLCRDHDAQLLLGGAGEWPDPPPFGDRVRTFDELRTLLGRG